MPIVDFPPVDQASAEGVVGVGGDLHPQSLLLAYSRGIFPWPHGKLLAWFCPDPRAVLDFDRLHVGNSLARARRRLSYAVSVDRAFKEVIQACAAAPRPDQDDTWITSAVIAAYTRFHSLGHAHSLEIWEGPELIGGIYGVRVGAVFSAESMFYRRPYASKLAVLELCDYLRHCGLAFLDVQVMTPHMERLGAHHIPRTEFQRRLANSVTAP